MKSKIEFLQALSTSLMGAALTNLVGFTSNHAAIAAVNPHPSLPTRAEGGLGLSSPKSIIANTTAAPEVKILSPTTNTVLDKPAATVIAEYPTGANVEILVNGKPFTSFLATHTQSDLSKNVIKQTWFGILLEQGENTISARATVNGSVGELTTVKVLVGSASGQLKQEPGKGQIPVSGNAPVASPMGDAQPTNLQPSPAPSASPGTPSPNDNTPVSTEVKILTPDANGILDLPSSSVIVQYGLGAKLDLRVNGTPVDPSFIGRTAKDAKNKLVTQTWYGVSFQQGDNIITAQATANGAVGQPTTIKVHVRGAFTQIKVQTVEARIPADGRSTATIQGQLLDENGVVSNRDAEVTLEASAGEFVGVNPDHKVTRGIHLQAHKGQFTAILRSTVEAQTVRIRATTGKIEAFTQLQFETNLRPGIVTGVLDFRFGAKGTDYYSSFRDFLPTDRKNGYHLDTHSAVFATGRVLGNWSFTGAYNSDRNLNQTCNGDSRLFQDFQQSCDEYYSTYGDNSKSEALASSQDSVYLRLERSTRLPGAAPDFFMWGDYSTQEFATRSQEFTATTRQLHGFKTNYNFGNLQATGFYGNNVQGFQRDTVAPDGTSGYYFLSRRLLLIGSENVFLETEEFDRPGTVISRKILSRGADYEIDYDRGTLLFHQPIGRTDVDTNGLVLVRRIVVTYQYGTSGSDNNIYGGRVRYFFDRTLKQESWVGTTYIRENQGVRHFDLYGADTLISLGSRGSIIAEYAHSSNDSELLGLMTGSAYRLEAEGRITPEIQARAYFRSANTGFANDATVSFVPGQTRYGGQVIGKISRTTHLRLQYDREENRGIAPQPVTAIGDLLNPGTQAVPGSKVDNDLTTISVGVDQQIGKATLGLDLINRHRVDNQPTQPLNQTSTQLRSRLTYPLTDKLTFLAQNELNLSSSQDLVYPNRTIFSLDWSVYPGIDIRLNHQLYSGGQYKNNSITSIDVDGNYKLARDTTLTGRYSVATDGGSMQGAMGLKQGLTIAPGLRAELSYEHIFGNTFNRTGAGVQFAQPFAPGQSASSIGVSGGDSYSLGLAYTDNPNFQASARYEHRTSSGGNNDVLSASATGKVSPALTALFRFDRANTANQVLTGIGLGATVNLKLGLAYRDPKNDNFNALLRYEYRKNPSLIPDSIFIGTGTGSEDHTFAAEAIYAPNWQWEFYGKFAIRNSTSYSAQDLVGVSTITLSQLRATYRVGYSMDLVGEARWISQPATGYTETGFLAEVGYYLTPNLRAAAGYAFGRVSDRDFAGTRSAGGPYLNVTVKLNELFDGFGLQKIPPPQTKPQQTALKPVTPQLIASLPAPAQVNNRDATPTNTTTTTNVTYSDGNVTYSQGITPPTNSTTTTNVTYSELPISGVQSNPSTATPATGGLKL